MLHGGAGTCPQRGILPIQDDCGRESIGFVFWWCRPVVVKHLEHPQLSTRVWRHRPISAASMSFYTSALLQWTYDARSLQPFLCQAAREGHAIC